MRRRHTGSTSGVMFRKTVFHDSYPKHTECKFVRQYGNQTYSITNHEQNLRERFPTENAVVTQWALQHVVMCVGISTIEHVTDSIGQQL
ncbi:hypothetical protein TNCV_972721 [Trichonephila clavipes]|nr:hypothetical protein TNCV_972721 [Trichonephila clavipes]